MQGSAAKVLTGRPRRDRMWACPDRASASKSRKTGEQDNSKRIETRHQKPLMLGTQGARMMTGFMPSGFVPGDRECECRLREALDKLCGEDHPGPEGAR